MGKKDDTTTTTQTTTPWDKAIPHLTDIMNNAGNLFGSSNSTLQGRNVQPFFNQGMGALNNMFTGSGVFSSLADTAGGNYLDVTNSPQWGSMKGGIEDAVNSQFSMAGRTGSPAHAGVMTQELGNLAGRLYDSERTRQLGAASQLGQFTQGGLGLLPEMYGFGNADIDNLWQNLSRYAGIGQGIGSMGGTGKSTEEQKLGLLSQLTSVLAAGAGVAKAASGGK